MLATGLKKSASSLAFLSRSVPGGGHPYDCLAESDKAFHWISLHFIFCGSVSSLETYSRWPRIRNCSLVSRKYHMASAFALASISPIFSLRRSVMNFRMFGFFSSSRNPRNTTVLALGSLPLTVARVRNFDVGSPFSFSIDLSRNCLHTGASSFAHVAIPWARALLSLSYADAADAILASAAVARLRTGICLIIDVERPQRIAG
mmetsp:Transcript_10646/g.20409  ORF Transcript_10646/g.20409 Transcript_10646/m.20409 type:complete len:204 (+) Transcript_10646:514-1125(+)